jgi:hypothetical protein
MSKVILDNLEIHSDDLGDVVGDFHGTPIRQYDSRATEAREQADARKRMAFARNYVPEVSEGDAA